MTGSSRGVLITTSSETLARVSDYGLSRELLAPPVKAVERTARTVGRRTSAIKSAYA